MEPGADGGLVDHDTLRDLDETLGPTFVAECIEVYLDDAGRLRSEIEAALAAGDATRLARAAHALGSASATVGAAALCRLCRRIEHGGAGATTVPALATAYDQAMDALRAERDRRRD